MDVTITDKREPEHPGCRSYDDFIPGRLYAFRMGDELDVRLCTKDTQDVKRLVCVRTGDVVNTLHGPFTPNTRTYYEVTGSLSVELPSFLRD